jgi:hypothetical protein
MRTVENSTLALVSVILSSVGTLIIGVSAWLLWRQLRETHEWNRRKCSQEVLTNLVTGEFPRLREKLERELGCRILHGDETYDSKIKGLDPETRLSLDHTLARLLNILETVCINIKNHLIDEEICYDYLGWIAVQYRDWSDSFIRERRSLAEDQRVLGDVTAYADAWKVRMRDEREAIAKASRIRGKDRL